MCKVTQILMCKCIKYCATLMLHQKIFWLCNAVTCNALLITMLMLIQTHLLIIQIFPNALLTWFASHWWTFVLMFVSQLSLKGPPGPLGLTGRPGPLVSVSEQGIHGVQTLWCQKYSFCFVKMLDVFFIKVSVRLVWISCKNQVVCGKSIFRCLSWGHEVTSVCVCVFVAPSSAPVCLCSVLYSQLRLCVSSGS